MDFIQQINNNFGNTLCQAFDPLMLIEGKANDIIPGSTRINTSCKAPAYVFVDGAHGARYLCDFHFAIERSSEYGYDGIHALSVFKLTVLGLEKIKETFPTTLPEEDKPSNKCWCTEDSYVFLYDPGEKQPSSGLCNFHFRKHLYRNLSNGIDLYKKYTILDYRKLILDIPIEEEIVCLPQL